MTLAERRCLFTLNVSKLIQYINSIGYQCAGDELKRTKEQAEIYAKQGKGSKNSLHISGLAIDLLIYKNGIYQDGRTKESNKPYELASVYWLSLHPDNKWGGVGGDGNHFSMSNINGKW
jgi:hypothetical protein